MISARVIPPARRMTSSTWPTDPPPSSIWLHPLLGIFLPEAKVFLLDIKHISELDYSALRPPAQRGEAACRFRTHWLAVPDPWRSWRSRVVWLWSWAAARGGRGQGEETGALGGKGDGARAFS